MRIRLHRLGVHQGNDDIEPSCGVMDVLEGSAVKYRIVTDCGLIPKSGLDANSSWIGPDFSLFQDGKKIDAVRITHVHGDHVGRLPALVPYLSESARIYMTRPSAAMLDLILADGIKIAELRGSEKPYNYYQMIEVSRRLRVIERPGEIEILPGITDFVHPEGHINGACSFTARIGSRNIHYSGDRCSHDQPGVSGANLLPEEWRPQIIAGADCTYGADYESDQRTWEDEMNRGAALCAETIRRGKPVLIFTFGIHRGGVLAHELARRGIGELARIYLDGSCREFSKITNRKDAMWCDLDQRLEIDSAQKISGHYDRVEIVNSGRPYVAITTPGMGGPSGPGTWWRKYVLPIDGATVIFSGYVAPGTDGDKMLRASEERARSGRAVLVNFTVQNRFGKLEEEQISLQANIAQIRVGSHNSRRQTLDWFSAYKPEVAVLSHGSRAALESLERDLYGAIPKLARTDIDRTIEIEI